MNRAPRLAWAGFAVLVVLLAFWYSLDLPGAPGFKRWLVGQPERTMPLPRMNPEGLKPPILEIPPAPAPENKNGSNGSKGSGRPSPLGPRPSKTRSLFAQRVKVGEFTSVIGEPRVTFIGEKASRRALPKMPVTTAMRIETGDMDKTEIRFADGSTIALSFNTSVVVPADHFGGSGGPITAKEISVSSGSIKAHIAHSEERGRFAVRTPVATAEVLGTEFSLALKRLPMAKGKTKLSAVLQVQEGRVAFYNELGRVVASAATQSTATEGYAPTEPKRLVTLKAYEMGDSHSEWFSFTAQLEETEAASLYEYPRGNAGMTAATLDRGEVRIVEVDPGSPAGKAGLKVGDVIVAMNGESVQDSQTVHRAIYRAPCTPIELTIRRNGERLTVRFATVQAYPPPPRLPQPFAARLYAATWPAMSGDTERSLRMLHALANEEESAAVYNNLGVIYETRDAMGKAIRSYQAAVRLNPHCSLYRLNLGFALNVIGNTERAVEELENAVESDRGFWQATAKLSSTFSLLDRNDEALAVLEAARPRFERLSSFWIAKSEVLRVSDRLNEARDAVAKAIEIDPDNWEAYAELGAILQWDAERKGGAEAPLRKALDLNPIETDVLNSLGVVLNDLGRREEAEAMYRKAIDLDPKFVMVQVNLANLLTDTGRVREAEAMYRKAIDLDPKSALAYASFVQLLNDTGRIQEAEAMCRKAIELDTRLWQAYFNFGNLMKAAGRLQDAEAMYREAIALNPKHGDAHYNLASLLDDAGRLKEAEAMYRKAISLDPKDGNACTNLGLLLQNTGRLQEAEAMYRKAIGLDPKAAIVRYNLGNLLSGSGRFQEAEAMYHKAIELRPTYAHAFINLGVLMETTGRLQEAEGMFRKAIELAPDDETTYSNLGALLVRMGRNEEAEAILRKAIKLDPRDAEACANLGMLFQSMGRPKEAEPMYHKAIELKLRDAPMYKNLGLVLHQLGRLQEAEAAFRKAISLDPRFAEASFDLGILLQQLNRLDDAEAMYRKTIELDPKGATPYNNLGILSRQFGRLKEAEATFRKAIELDPKLSSAYDNLGQLLDQQGRMGEAEVAYRGWVEACPQDPSALNSLAWFLADHNLKLPEALEFAKRTVAIPPSNPDYLDTLGWVYYRQKEFEKAEETFKKALALFKPAPRVADCWVHLGLTYEGQRQRDRAIDAYRHALNLQPQHKGAQDALKRLGG